MILIGIRLYRRWQAQRLAAAAASGGVATGADGVATAGALLPGRAATAGALVPGRAAVARGSADAAGSSAVARGSADAAGASPAASGPLALLLHQARFDLRASLRNPRARFFTIVFPLLMLVIFTSVFGHGTTIVDGVRVELARYFVAGILALSIINAAYSSLVITVVATRETGILKRRRATPAPAWVLVAGQALSTLAIAAAMAVVLLVVAALGWGVTFGAGALAAIAVTVVVGTLAFACLGYAVAGLIGSADAAQPVVQLTLFPLYFISGVWIPSASLPHGLQTVASLFPIEHLAAALHLASVHASFTAALAPGDLAVLAVWGVAAAALAARRFSWLPRAAVSAGRLRVLAR